MTVLFFARARDLAGCERWEADQFTETTVAQLRSHLAERFPRLAPLLAKSALAVNGAFAKDGDMITSSAEVAVLPPVSGG